MTKRDGSSVNIENSGGGSWLDRPEEEVVRLAQDEAASEQDSRVLAKRHGLTRLEIGRLIHAFKEEHGNRYRTGLFQRVADMAGITLRSARNYYYLYRLTVEGKDWANLPNLSPSALYQLAPLMAEPDGMEAILRLADEAVTNRYTVSQVAQAVKTHKKWGKKPEPKPKPEPTIPNPPPTEAYSVEDEDALSKASAVLARCGRSDFNPAVIPHMAEHRMRLHQLGAELLDHIANIVEKNPSDFDNLEPTIAAIRARCDIILAQGRTRVAA